MKKDIQIPTVTDVEMAVVYEYNDLYNSDDWNIYIINKKDVDLEMMIIVSQGFSETKTTSLIRKKITLLPAHSFAKVELIQPELFALDNRFQISFFEGKTLFEKTFLFPKNTINQEALQPIKALNNKKGIVIA